MLKRLRSFLFITLIVFTSQAYSQNNGLAFESGATYSTSDDFVSVPAGSSYVTGSSEMSITCWVYPMTAAPSYPNFDGFAGFRNDTDADFYLVQVGANALEGRFRNSTGTAFTITAQIITLNTWQHFTLTYGNGWLKLYKNGVVADSVSANGTITNANVPFYIGKVPYSINDFMLKGKMDETSLWSRELLPAELYCMPAEGIDSTATGLQLLYRFNQGIAGGTNTGLTSLTDATGHANGVLNGFALSGTTSNFVTGATAINSTVGFTCPDVAYNFNGQMIYTAGVYTDTLVSSRGCDSIVQLSLSVLSVDTLVTLNWNTLTANHVGLNYQWLDCNNGYAPVAGATTRVWSPTVPGNYACIITQGACTDTSGCHVVATVGLENLNVNSEVQVQPTITASAIKVLFDKTPIGIKVAVVDFTGKQISNTLSAESREMQIDLSGYASGVYFIRVSDGNRIGMHKVVKQ